MPSDDEIEARVSAVEIEAERTRDRLAGHDREIADTRRLASGTDQDVAAIIAKLNAHQGSMNALHLSQQDLLRRMSGVEVRMDRFEGRMATLEVEMRSGFAMMGAGFAAIGERLDRAFPDEG